MCGIAGCLHFDRNRPADAAVLHRMAAALHHRGPDDGGVHVDGPAGLAHRRLSIIDLSPAGHQPMANADRTVWIAFNGEIYNFRELRAELEREGHAFRSRTDTEVLLQLYERHGVDCLRRLRGMFAFAIWDRRAGRLLLARDRLGVKPLHYRLDPSGLYFASELKGLIRLPDARVEVDPLAIHHFLTYQYVPSGLCAFRGIRKLPPAHYLLAENGRVTVARWWQLDYEPKHPAGTRRRRRALEDELLERLDEAVRIRMVSDVPLGAFLSGGIDSSAVVASMVAQSADRVRTFSIGFGEEGYDEMPAARAIAQRFDTEHTEFRVTPDALALLPELARLYDEPFADASAIPTFVVSRLARERVTVALNGDGGDEAFAGYDRHRAGALARRLGWLGHALGSRHARRLIDALPHGADPHDPRWKLKRFARHLAAAPGVRNARWMSQLDSAERDALYSGGFRDRVAGVDPHALLFEHYREAHACDPLDVVLAADVAMYLPDALLTKVDLASMGNSLEARSPLLDHELMEFAARLPADLKLQGGTTKAIFKRALRRRIPRDILTRPKRGFSVPIDAWLRGDLRTLAGDVLLDRTATSRGWFQDATVRRMLDEHWSGRRNWHGPLWSLLVLELWHREWVDPAAPAGAPAPAGGSSVSARP